VLLATTACYLNTKAIAIQIGAATIAAATTAAAGGTATATTTSDSCSQRKH